jgi:hypothetical protein
VLSREEGRKKEAGELGLDIILHSGATFPHALGLGRFPLHFQAVNAVERHHRQLLSRESTIRCLRLTP